MPNSLCPDGADGSPSEDNVSSAAFVLDPARHFAQRRRIEPLLHDEEAKLKKYDDDIEKDSPGFGKTD